MDKSKGNLKSDPTAEEFINALEEFKSEKELGKAEKFFKGNDRETEAFGVKFGDVFKTAKKFQAMPIMEIEKLLESKHYEIRMGGVSIMDYQAKDKKTTPERKQELFELYLTEMPRSLPPFSLPYSQSESVGGR